MTNRWRTLGTCGLNSTARCIASTAFISAVLKPRLDAMSGENLQIGIILITEKHFIYEQHAVISHHLLCFISVSLTKL